MKSIRKKKWLKWIVTTCSVLLVVVAAFVGYSYFFSEEEQAVAARSTATVQTGNLEVNVSGSGNIQPAEKESIKATVEAVVENVNYQEGDLVKQGDVIVTFEQKDIAAQVSSEQLNLEGKLLDLEEMQDKYKSAEDDATRDSLGISIKRLVLDIQIARESIATLQEETAIDPIISPIDGKLTVIDVKVGETPTRNAIIAEVVDYANLQIVIAIDELDIPKVTLGQQATISVESLPDSTFTGEVVDIAEEGASSNGVATFDVTVFLENGVGIKSGMSAEASILVESKENTLYLPIEAVQSLRGRYYVTLPSSAASTEEDESTSTDSNEGTVPSEGVRGQRSQNTGLQEGKELPEGMELPEGGFPQRTGTGASGAQAGNSAIRFIEVGIHNEDYIEIVSGLSEGDVVILPMTVGSTTTNQQTQGGIRGAGVGGIGGVTGGGGFTPPAGGGSFGGGGR